MRQKSDDRLLTLKQVFKYPYMNMSDYEKYGVYFQNLTAQEIKDAVVERYKRNLGNWVSDENEEDLQNKFWKKFDDELNKPGSLYFKQNGWRHPSCRIGTDFLKKNINRLII